MGEIDPVLILHVSDLHFGNHGHFADLDPANLAELLFKSISEERIRRGITAEVGMVVVTGDIAQAAMPIEYKQALIFFETLSDVLRLERHRIIFSPGNHDVSRLECKKVDIEQEIYKFDDEELRLRFDECKFKHFDDFRSRFYRRPYENVAQKLDCGAFIHDLEDLRLSVGVLNSCEKESNRKEDHFGMLSKAQTESVMKYWREPAHSRNLKIVAVHHNPSVSHSENVEVWVDYFVKKGGIDKDTARIFATDIAGLHGKDFLRHLSVDCHVSLILHGHQHRLAEESWPWGGGAIGQTHIISAGSHGLDTKMMPKDQPNSVGLIQLDLQKEEFKICSLVHNPRARSRGSVISGHFVPDNAETDCYRQQLSLSSGFRGGSWNQSPYKTLSSQSLKFIAEYRCRFSQYRSSWEPYMPFSFQSIEDQKTAKLEDLYQPLRFDRHYNLNTTRGTGIGPFELLKRKKHLLINGYAGSGKTTWIRWTFHQLLADDKAFPMLIEVRSLASEWQDQKGTGADSSFDSYLYSVVINQMGGKNRSQQLVSVLQNNNGPKPILLIDGWDEVGEFADEFKDRLLGFLVCHPQVLVIATSRFHAVGQPSPADGYDRKIIQPLSDAEIENFVNRVFGEYYRDDFASSEQKTRQFIAALKRTQGAFTIARTPLYLVLLMSINPDLLQGKLHRIYNTCIKMILQRPTRKQTVDSKPPPWQYTPEDVDERLRVAAMLAFNAQERSRDKKLQTVEIEWAQMQDSLPTNWVTEKKDGFLRWLIESAGLLKSQADKTLSFVHHSFQEYLSAWYLSKKFTQMHELKKVCKDRMRIVRLWDTLRLWAAEVNIMPENLEPVLEFLMEDKKYGFWLAGSLFADGIGSEKAFRKWRQRMVGNLAFCFAQPVSTCAQNWARSRQDFRRKEIDKTIERYRTECNWLQLYRLNLWNEESSNTDASPSISKSTITQLMHEALEGNSSTFKNFAVGRILTNASYCWPGDKISTMLLQLWPGKRRLAGISLQCLVTFFDGNRQLRNNAHQLLKTAGICLLKEEEATDPVEHESCVRDWAIYWARNLSKYWAHYFTNPSDQDTRNDWDKDSIQRFARDWASESAIYWGDQWRLKWARTLALDWTIDATKGPARRTARNFNNYFILNQKWVIMVANYWASYWARYWAQYKSPATFVDQALNWLGDLGLGSIANILLDYVWTELTAFGRIGLRSFLAHMKKRPEVDTSLDKRLLELFIQACRLSLHHDSNLNRFNKALEDLPEKAYKFWRVFARHIARRSTNEDVEFLQNIAKYPEGHEAPLSWQIQYIVRGDILLNNGDNLTLDTLSEEVGLAPLPYLEPVPKNLDVDWDSTVNSLEEDWWIKWIKG
jgi:3',5'-cyclic AMP phosphodiesterase CpdA